MYDVAIAKRLMEVCQFVYDFKGDGPSGKTGHEKFEGGEVKLPTLKGNKKVIATSTGALVTFADMRVLAFSGTYSEFRKGNALERTLALLDWFQNLRAIAREAAGFEDTLPEDLAGRIHEGFGLELALVWENAKALAADNPKRLPLYVTGHSQGGAVAAIATACLKAEKIPVKAAYTFAAPRPGDAAFAAAVKTPVFRFEFGDDIVPHVPLPDGFASIAEGFLGNVTSRLGSFLSGLADVTGSFALLDADYSGVGTLVYRREGDDAPQTDFSPAEEATLMAIRRAKLLMAGKDLAEHHHIVASKGTTGKRYSTMLD